MQIRQLDIGDRIQLLQDWTFEFLPEDRNATLAVWAGMEDEFQRIQRMSHTSLYAFNGNNWTWIGPYLTATIPAGSILKVDRVYIRKNAADYSSITFLLENQRAEFGPTERWRYKGQDQYEKVTVNKPKRTVRFYAHLRFVNAIDAEILE